MRMRLHTRHIKDVPILLLSKINVILKFTLPVTKSYKFSEKIRIAQSVQRLATGLAVRGWNPGGARYSAPVQTGPGPHPTSCTMGTALFPGGKAAGAWRWSPTPYSAHVKERVELYLYSALSWQVIGLPLLLFSDKIMSFFQLIKIWDMLALSFLLITKTLTTADRSGQVHISHLRQLAVEECRLMLVTGDLSELRSLRLPGTSFPIHYSSVNNQWRYTASHTLRALFKRWS